MLLFPKAGGDNNVCEPKAGGYHNVPRHQKATFEVSKQFMGVIVLTQTPWPIISDEKYSMFDETWKLAIAAQEYQRALADALVGTTSVCQLAGGPSHEIDPQIQKAVSVYSVFCSSIELMVILNPQKSIIQTND